MSVLQSHFCPSPSEFAARIKLERARLGLTQRRAAAILGISHSSWRQYEDGRFEPRLSTLFAMVEFLKMDRRTLLPEWCEVS